MIPTPRRRSTMTARLAVGAVCLGLLVSGCGSNASPTAPEISGDMAPAPGSQTGLRTVADVDYEQFTLSADTQLIKLAKLAQEPARDASTKVKDTAKEISKIAGPDAKELRMRLIESGDALTDHHGSGTKDAQQLQELTTQTGTTFDKNWKVAVLAANQEIIDAATTELNRGEDQETRALARKRIESASKLKSQLSGS
ncbi:MAG: DUF305 domain-containing protein [Candidatus Nanopelagicales bacterium]